MQYRQLTMDDRCQLYEMLHQGATPKAMAAALGVHPSTISRELSRNRSQRGYRPHQAQEKAQERRKLPRRPSRLTPELRGFIAAKLREDWSPEQIAGWLKGEGRAGVSPETIYLLVYADQRRGGDLFTHLRRRRGRRRSRAGKRDRRGQIKDRVMIDHRPAVVDDRSRVGDWETDTLLGKQESQALLSAVERRSRYTVLAKLKDRKAASLAAAMVELLSPVRERVLTLTSDNGHEFADHQNIAAALQADFYFAHPYAAWERGCVENTNGLIRQYVPKRSSLDTISPGDIEFIMHRLNHRPRKRLGFRTPHEVFAGKANL